MPSIRQFLVIASACVLAAIPALAAPTVNGATGLIEVPTAEALQYREINVGLDAGLQPNDSIAYFYKFNMGTFKGWELGAVGGTVPTEGVFINIKYFLMQDAARYPLSLAIGIERLASTTPSVYLVASKKFKGGFNGHFGFQGTFDSTGIDTSVITGMEYFLNNSLSFLTDLRGERKRYRWNTGVRYYLGDEWAFRFAVRDITNATDVRAVYELGFSYSTFIE